DCGSGVCSSTPAAIPDGGAPDAGGAACLQICQSPSCGDAVKNADESDVDCGGLGCPSCGADKRCNASTDCASGLCEAGFCLPADCDDGLKNGSETDVDCGGACPPCGETKGCKAGADCVTRS